MMDWNSTLTNFSWIWEEPNFEEASFLSKEEMLIYYSPRVFHSIQATILLKNDVNVSSFGHCWNPWNCAKVLLLYAAWRMTLHKVWMHLIFRFQNGSIFALLPQSMYNCWEWWCLRIVTFSAIHFFQKTHNSVKDDSHNWFDIAFSPLFSTADAASLLGLYSAQ